MLGTAGCTVPLAAVEKGGQAPRGSVISRKFCLPLEAGPRFSTDCWRANRRVYDRIESGQIVE